MARSRWRRWGLWLTVGPVVCAAFAWGLGAWRWHGRTQTLRDDLASCRVEPVPTHYDERELADLPPCVQRYFRAVLRAGQPLVAAAQLDQRGTMDLGDAAESWRPFTAAQHVVAGVPGFVWDARVSLLPGLAVHVHDAYVQRDGVLEAAVLGLWPVASARGAELAAGELLRFLAEAVWYPTALLPSQGVQWTAAGAGAARAMLRDGGAEATLTFTFAADGRVESVHAEARGRTVGGRVEPTPWRGRFWDYAERGGMQIPLQAEVAWLLPGGARPYWRGRIEAIAFEWAR